MRDFIFTSESVTEGHPDKICDQISDAVLDALLTEDPESRVACETVVNTGLCLLTGEITSKAKIDYIKHVRNVIKDSKTVRRNIIIINKFLFIKVSINYEYI